MVETYTTFGNYLLLKQRSKDGLGALWRAGEMERTGFKRIAWLRRFDGIGIERGGVPELTFANQVAQTLKASAIARNATYAREKGVLFVAWDYIPAQPLDQLLERVSQEQFPVAIDNALLIAEKISAALASGLTIEAQGEGLVHGFLLPHMVMIGNDGEAMVTGFGISKSLLAARDKPAVKQCAAPYLAPEVLAGSAPSKRGDVYSVGAILYHLLAGQALPVDPAERSAPLEKPALAFEEGPVPQDVLGILHKALAAKPEERYGSAADLKRELEKLLYGGAYSPTTFNLALFMDRLYRNDIEQEDRELQRERTLDVASYYQPPKPAATLEVPLQAEAQVPPSKTGLYAAIGGAVVLLGVILYLLLGRGGGGSDQAAIRAEVEKQFAAFNQQLKSLQEQAAADKAEADKLRKELEEAKKAPPATGPKVDPEEQKRRAAQIAEELRKREEAEQRRQAEIARLQENMTRLKTQAAIPTAAPAVPTPTSIPPTATPVPVATSPAAVVPTAAAPVAAPTAVPAAPTPVQVPALRTQVPAPVPGLPGGAVAENDFVKPELVDSQPQVLQEAKVVLPRSAAMVRQNISGPVILRALVNAKGSVEEVTVLRPFPGSVAGVDDACVEAVRQYRFKPATKGGVKVKTYSTVTIPITLKAR